MLILHSRCLHLRQLDQEEDDPQMMLKMPYKSVRIAVGNFHCHSSRLRVVGSLEPVTFVLSEALKRVPKVSYHHEAFYPLNFLSPTAFN